MKSELAKARDKWLSSEDGKECCRGTTTGQYLQNRLERAFLAGANLSMERIKELEKRIEVIRCNRNEIFSQNVRNYGRLKELWNLLQRAYDSVPKGSSLQREIETGLKGK